VVPDLLQRGPERQR